MRMAVYLRDHWREALELAGVAFVVYVGVSRMLWK